MRKWTKNFLIGMISLVSIAVISPEIAGAYTAEVTAYSWESGDTTAMGTPVHEGIVASRRTDIELGSPIWINGVKYIVEDRMSPKAEADFDIWMPSTEQANNFGIQQCDVEF